MSDEFDSFQGFIAAQRQELERALDESVIPNDQWSVSLDPVFMDHTVHVSAHGMALLLGLTDGSDEVEEADWEIIEVTDEDDVFEA